jgi:hypothetical protein
VVTESNEKAAPQRGRGFAAGMGFVLVAQMAVMAVVMDAYPVSVLVLGGLMLVALIARRWWVALGMLVGILPVVAWWIDHVMLAPGAFRTVH